MAFDPTKPANNSPLSAAEMRGQLGSLKTLIDAKTDDANLLGVIQANSSGPIAGQVDFLSLTVSNPPTQAEVQAIADKIDELITVLKRA